MIQSMTAFGRVETKEIWGEASWDIRSVNHRYLDLTLKLPEQFRKYDLAWRDIIKKHVKRGKVECTLNFKPAVGASQELELNESLAKQLISLGNQVNEMTNDGGSLNVSDFLKWPGMVVVKEQKHSLEEPLTTALSQAASQLVEVRGREGLACIHVMKERLEQIGKLQTLSKSYGPQIEVAFKERLMARLGELKTEVDSQRFEQELLIFLQKIDVSEELDRLNMHIKEVDRIISKGGSVGRRLDFMMQELNREANTLASKSPDPSLTQAAVEMKVCIEQLREQIQNLE